MTMATYGHRVVSDDDAYVNLVEKTNSMTVQSGTPGGTVVDFFPACMYHQHPSSVQLSSNVVVHYSTTHPGMVSGSGLQATGFEDARARARDVNYALRACQAQ